MSLRFNLLFFCKCSSSSVVSTGMGWRWSVCAGGRIILFFGYTQPCLVTLLMVTTVGVLLALIAQRQGLLFIPSLPRTVLTQRNNLDKTSTVPNWRDQLVVFHLFVCLFFQGYGTQGLAHARQVLYL
jgi:hypothetical protein